METNPGAISKRRREATSMSRGYAQPYNLVFFPLTQPVPS